MDLSTDKEYSANNISIHCKYQKSLNVTGVVFRRETSQKVSKLFCSMWNTAATPDQLGAPHLVSNKSPLPGSSL